MKKFVLFGAIIGTAMFLANNASAVLGVFSLTATVQIQGYATNKNNSDQTPVIKKQSFSQKDLLFILEQGTGDTTITNKLANTKILFDPDAINANATAWVQSQGGVETIFGVFYYTNSEAGIVPLDGVDGNGYYYSYMEFDFYNSLDGYPEGFWNPNAMEYNSVVNSTGSGATEAGNAILYIHENPYEYNLLGNWNQGAQSAFLFANDWNEDYSDYALVIHGTITFKASLSQSKNVETESESFSLKGSGDGLFNDVDGVVTGTATFSGKGLDELPF